MDSLLLQVLQIIPLLEFLELYCSWEKDVANYSDDDIELLYNY